MIECYRYKNSAFEKIENPLADYPFDGDFDNEPEKADYRPQWWKKSTSPYISQTYIVFRNTRRRRGLPKYLVEVRGKSGRMAWYAANDMTSLSATLVLLAPFKKFATSLE